MLIVIDSRGPIFYTQERLGYRGSCFSMYKFRTMQVAAGQQTQLTWTTSRDPRITRIGRFLRATHLDELPQALNILRGEMSLIGPRPELLQFASTLEKELPQYRSRLHVKPGLTGWAQVMYHYGDTLQDEQIKLSYDLYYIAHQSFLLDLQILLKTVGEVVRAHGR
ncbi:sugar transferase [Dictyobacter halimunensis]